ncbi:TPA: hypothetical protein ACGR3O_001016, partial [Enterobacter mori]
RYDILSLIISAPRQRHQHRRPERDKNRVYVFFCVYTHFPPPGMTIQDISNQRRYKKRRLKIALSISYRN